MGATIEMAMAQTQTQSSFASWKDYMAAVAKTPERLTERMANTAPAPAEMDGSGDGNGGMQRRLRVTDLVAMGVGGMIGAGIFVTTGQAAKEYAGPAVILSYIVAGFSALMSALCYAEFSVEIPSAGGAFTYLRLTLGEFAAYLTGANLIMEYVISNAAVARSFTSYFACVFGLGTNAWRIQVYGLPNGYNMLDLPAVGVILLLTLCICWSTKVSSTFNIAITILHLGLIAFVVVVGFVVGSPHNLTSPSGFAPFGTPGILNGAALVYFSYIGYDAVSTMAEEVHKPSKTMPIAIAGSVVIVTILYCLMATAIVMLLPYNQIDPNAPFSSALRQKVGWTWASNVVGLGACIGIISSLLVAMLGQARYLAVIGRANMIPKCFAKIDSRTGTPLNASIFLGLVTAAVALFTDMQILLDLIAIGTLFVFYMVANGLIYRRYARSEGKNTWPTIAFLVLISCVSIVFVALWQLGKARVVVLSISTLACLVLTIVFKILVPITRPSLELSWNVLLMPFLPVASIFLNVFLMGSIQKEAFLRFGIWSACACLFYVAFSVHASYDASRNATIHPTFSLTSDIHMSKSPSHNHHFPNHQSIQGNEHSITIYGTNTLDPVTEL